MATGRHLDPEALAETSQAGLQEILGKNEGGKLTEYFRIRASLVLPAGRLSVGESHREFVSMG